MDSATRSADWLIRRIYPEQLGAAGLLLVSIAVLMLRFVALEILAW